MTFVSPTEDMQKCEIYKTRKKKPSVTYIVIFSNWVPLFINRVLSNSH